MFTSLDLVFSDPWQKYIPIVLHFSTKMSKKFNVIVYLIVNYNLMANGWSYNFH